MAIEKYVNPFTDFGFKKLFGEEDSKELLIDFLNQMLPEKHQIESLEYSKNEQVGNTVLDRRAIFDLYCKSEKGDRFLVEVQKVKQSFFKDRTIFYSSFLIQEQSNRGDWNFQLSAVYTIGILDFTFSNNKINQNGNDYFHYIQLKDRNNDLFYDKLTYIYLEVPKFTKKVSELTTRFEKWMYVFRHLPRLLNRPIELQERVFEMLFRKAEIAKFSKTERVAYQTSVKIRRDWKNIIDTAVREGSEKARKQAMKKGIKQGIEKGIERGIEQSILNLLQQGVLSVDQIAKAFQMTVEQVEAIRKKYQ